MLDRAVIDALPVAVYACDRAARIVGFNRRAVELWAANRLLASALRVAANDPSGRVGPYHGVVRCESGPLAVCIPQQRVRRSLVPVAE
jgi:hypothetical protein